MTNDNQRLLNPNTNPEKVLTVPVKKCGPVELYEPLRKLVTTKYSENDAEKIESVLKTLHKCRSDMVERGDLSLHKQRDCLIHYFKCLCMVKTLFTSISSDADADSDAIVFVWYDAFNPEHEGRVPSQPNNIALELAAVVFNLGAVCSQIGASYDRTTALGRHLAMDAFDAAAKFFFELWKVFAKDVSATLDLTLLFAECLHRLFCAQAWELKLQQHLDYNNNDAAASSALQQHRCAFLFKWISENYKRAHDLILSDSAANDHVHSFDSSWIIHLHRKAKFFRWEARQRRSSILPTSQLPKTFSLFQSSPLDHEAESVTEKLVGGICGWISLVQSYPFDLYAELVRKIWKLSHKSIPKQQRIPYLDLLLSEYSSFKIIGDGKLVANPWDMPPPYPTNLEILSSSPLSDMLPIPLKKSQPLDLYESLRSYVALKYSESEANRLEGLFKMVDKLRSEMQRDDLSLPVRRDRLIHYFKSLCMIEPLFPMASSPNPPIFVWYNAFNPQQDSSQHNIHLEKASVLFNLGALCTQIALSCDLRTVQGHRLAMDALYDASQWFFILSKLEAEKASDTTDLSVNFAQALREIIAAQIAELTWSCPHSHSDGSSLAGLAGYLVTLHCRKAYDLSALGTLAENPIQSSILEFLESKMKTRSVQTDPSDVVQQFLSGYCEAQSLLQEGCQTPFLVLLSEVDPFKIADGNIVANFTGTNVAIGGDELAGDHPSNIPMEEN